jgi:hypothetical protein
MILHQSGIDRGFQSHISWRLLYDANLSLVSRTVIKEKGLLPAFRLGRLLVSGLVRTRAGRRQRIEWK